MTDIPVTDQQNILRTLDGLPPITEWQNERFAVIREHFEDIRADLASFFSGQKPPLIADRKRQRLVESESTYYRKLYELIWRGWWAIERELEARGIEGFPQCPGDAIALALEVDCDLMLQGSRINVRESKALLADGIPHPEGQSGTDRKRAERTVAYAQEVKQRADLGSLPEFCVGAVKKRCKAKTDLQRAAREFDAARKQRIATQKKLLLGVRGI